MASATCLDEPAFDPSFYELPGADLLESAARLASNMLGVFSYYKKSDGGNNCYCPATDEVHLNGDHGGRGLGIAFTVAHETAHAKDRLAGRLAYEMAMIADIPETADFDASITVWDGRERWLRASYNDGSGREWSVQIDNDADLTDSEVVKGIINGPKAYDSAVDSLDVYFANQPWEASADEQASAVVLEFRKRCFQAREAGMEGFADIDVDVIAPAA